MVRYFTYVIKLTTFFGWKGSITFNLWELGNVSTDIWQLGDRLAIYEVYIIMSRMVYIIMYRYLKMCFGHELEKVGELKS